MGSNGLDFNEARHQGCVHRPDLLGMPTPGIIWNYSGSARCLRYNLKVSGRSYSQVYIDSGLLNQ